MNESMTSIVESIDAIAKQRDELRRQLEERTETLSVARVNMFQAEQDARKAERERDEALAALKVSDEGRAAAIRMMDAWKDKADKADEALSELREAVRALLGDFENAKGDPMTWCDAFAGGSQPACPRLATQGFLYDCLCDEHAAEHIAEHPGLDLRPRELSYAPALRRLRALVEVPRG